MLFQIYFIFISCVVQKEDAPKLYARCESEFSKTIYSLRSDSVLLKAYTSERWKPKNFRAGSWTIKNGNIILRDKGAEMTFVTDTLSSLTVLVSKDLAGEWPQIKDEIYQRFANDADLEFLKNVTVTDAASVNAKDRLILESMHYIALTITCGRNILIEVVN